MRMLWVRVFPALTSDDEFIVPVDMVEAVHEARYTTDFEGLW